MTSAAELFRLAIAFNARLRIDEDKLVLDAPAEFPLGLVQLLRDHKAELLEYLSQHPEHNLKKYRCKYPISSQAGDPELEEILQTVQQRGFILVWSDTLKDLVAFYRLGLDLRNIPPGFVPYSTREMEVLFCQVADWSTDSLRLIHEVKKYGARIIDRQAGDLQ